MRREMVHWTLMASAGTALRGCGTAKCRSPVPEFMRAKAGEPPRPEPPPDVSRLVHEKLDSVFIATSYPRQVRVSPPHHEPYGQGWSACVRAELTSVMGKPLGTETYGITISASPILDRRQPATDDNCEATTND